MYLEARITVHEKFGKKPDYSTIHAKMYAAGYVRVFSVGGHTLSELHGMYRKLAFLPDIDAEQRHIATVLRSVGFAFSIELFRVTDSRSFNLNPAPQPLPLSTMLAALYPPKR